jgi:ribosomal protein S26
MGEFTYGPAALYTRLHVLLGILFDAQNCHTITPRSKTIKGKRIYSMDEYAVVVDGVQVVGLPYRLVKLSK